MKSAQQAVRSERSQELEEREKVIKEMAPKKTKRALYPATGKKFIGVADLETQQIYRMYKKEKKRLYSRRVLDLKHGTFTPLVFTTTGG